VQRSRVKYSLSDATYCCTINEYLALVIVLATSDHRREPQEPSATRRSRDRRVALGLFVAGTMTKAEKGFQPGEDVYAAFGRTDTGRLLSIFFVYT
jgi:hypothetical protein